MFTCDRKSYEILDDVFTNSSICKSYAVRGRETKKDVIYPCFSM
jgi:hypothetical protein